MVAETSEQLAHAFRGAMGQLAAGVVLVTTHVDDQPWGLTMSACCSISMSPPLLMVAPACGTVTARSIQETGRFGVSILGAGQLDVAQFGAASGVPKFVAEYCHPGDDGAAWGLRTPAVAGALAHVDCEVVDAMTAGDHVVCIGQVQRVLLDRRDVPLVYHDRDYHRLRPVGELDPLVIEASDFHYPPW
jgi:flavin reductase (DIM6/NTAB) family NADH-FMN oxidoreductase RutF